MDPAPRMGYTVELAFMVEAGVSQPQGCESGRASWGSAGELYQVAPVQESCQADQLSYYPGLHPGL